MLGRKISKERTGIADSEPTGWFLEFLLKKVRGRLRAEARADYKARKAVRSKSALILERICKISFSKIRTSKYYFAQIIWLKMFTFSLFYNLILLYTH